MTPPAAHHRERDALAPDVSRPVCPATAGAFRRGEPPRRLLRPLPARGLVIGLLTALSAACAGEPDARSASTARADLLDRVRALEDARPADGVALEPMMQALRHPDADVRCLALRAVGRLERAELIDRIATTLADPDPDVRAASANAVGQAAYRRGSRQALDVLLGRLREETDPDVRAAICRTLGRLPYERASDIGRAESAIVGALDGAPLAARVEIARGLESFVRLHLASRPPSAATLDRLQRLASTAADTPDAASIERAARVRRLATAAIIASGRISLEFAAARLDDADFQVRRLAAGVVGQFQDASLVERARRDPSFNVRYALMHGLATAGHPVACTTALRLLEDPNDHVAIRALDALADCRNTERRRAVRRLRTLADTGAAAAGWHRRAHALVALARLAPDRARPFVDAASRDAIWQVRMYAARAAAALENEPILQTLARDPHANVAEAALRALVAVAGRRADPLAIEALARPDYQLVRTAAAALEGSRDPTTVETLVAALRRLTAERRETSRDPRLAILDRLAELGGDSQADAVGGHLEDFDPVIAARAAEILSTWTGQPQQARARPLSSAPVPSGAELDELAGLRVVLEMRDRGEIELQLFPHDAPTATARFVRRARERYFDGLTFHRVVPNFVIQGGSPGANEYMGDGAYTRDELTARSLVRGTVGISTRGRDTGDGQIFVNLVDNPRLDHNFTIIGEVTRGLDVADAVLEGDVITRIGVEKRAMEP